MSIFWTGGQECHRAGENVSQHLTGFIQVGLFLFPSLTHMIIKMKEVNIDSLIFLCDQEKFALPFL